MPDASRIVRGGDEMKGENLYCKEQQKVTDLYRNNYDAVIWDREEREGEVSGGEEESRCDDPRT